MSTLKNVLLTVLRWRMLSFKISLHYQALQSLVMEPDTAVSDKQWQRRQCLINQMWPISLDFAMFLLLLLVNVEDSEGVPKECIQTKVYSVNLPWIRMVMATSKRSFQTKMRSSQFCDGFVCLKSKKQKKTKANSHTWTVRLGLTLVKCTCRRIKNQILLFGLPAANCFESLKSSRIIENIIDCEPSTYVCNSSCGLSVAVPLTYPGPCGSRMVVRPQIWNPTKT